jgi:hypothetical protein
MSESLVLAVSPWQYIRETDNYDDGDDDERSI